MYQVLVEQLERHITAERQLVATYQAAGAELELPTFDEALGEFDARLLAEPAGMSEKVRRFKAMGLVA